MCEPELTVTAPVAAALPGRRSTFRRAAASCRPPTATPSTLTPFAITSRARVVVHIGASHQHHEQYRHRQRHHRQRRSGARCRRAAAHGGRGHQNLSLIPITCTDRPSLASARAVQAGLRTRPTSTDRDGVNVVLLDTTARLCKVNAESWSSTTNPGGRHAMSAAPTAASTQIPNAPQPKPQRRERRRGLARPQALRVAARPGRPDAPVPRLGPRRSSPASASSGSTGRCSSSAIFPLLDLAIGNDASNPPDSVIKWLEQDRYYRWCTYLYIPIQYAGLDLRLLAVGARRPVRRSRASASR